MTDSNFTPNGQPQNLPGMDVTIENTQAESLPSSGESTVNVPPTTTPIQPPQPPIEYPEPEQTDDQKSHRSTIAYGIAVFFLVIVLIFGIMLIIWTVPKIVSSLNNVGKLPVVSNTATSTNPTHTTPIATSTPYTTATSTATSTKLVVSGPADLRVRILAVNRIGNDISVRFDVKNIGGHTSGTWSFSVTLPSNTNPIYYSVPQAPIAPQSGLINTLQFTPSASWNNQIGIKIFAQSGETNGNNNVANYVLY